MPHLSPEHLTRLVVAVYEAVGVGVDEAAIVARHMVGANLAGHDSHGVILLPTYVQRARKGDVVMDAPFDVVDDTPTTARIDGHWGLGQVMAAKAGFIAFMFCDSGRTSKGVVPFGGREARLGPNPICIELPSDLAST